jgi:hypothetical protein
MRRGSPAALSQERGASGQGLQEPAHHRHPRPPTPAPPRAGRSARRRVVRGPGRAVLDAVLAGEAVGLRGGARHPVQPQPVRHGPHLLLRQIQPPPLDPVIARGCPDLLRQPISGRHPELAGEADKHAQRRHLRRDQLHQLPVRARTAGRGLGPGAGLAVGESVVTVRRQTGRPPHGPTLQNRQLRTVLPAGKLHQALVLQRVHLLLMRRKELRVQRPAMPGRPTALAQRLQHRQRPLPVPHPAPPACAVQVRRP